MHARRRLSVALGVGCAGALAWVGRASVERVVLPVLPLHGDCLDSAGGWADLARGDLPAGECRGAEDRGCCPTASGQCEPALLLADDPEQPLAVRIVARHHALGAGCPSGPVALDDLTLDPVARRARGQAEIASVGPWAVEALAVHGLWEDAVTERAVLGDVDALDLLADLVKLDPGVRADAVRAVGGDPGRSLPRALVEAAGRPERGPNDPPPLGVGGLVDAPPDALDWLTGSGDATHALLAEAAAVRGFVGADRARLEAAVFSPVTAGSPPGDVHGAFVAGGGSPGATALAAELAWGGVSAWLVRTPGVEGAAVRISVPSSPGAPPGTDGATGWWLDGCHAPRRAEMSEVPPPGVAVSPLALALAEREGAWIRAGELERADEVDAVLQVAQWGGRWAPGLFPRDGAAPAGPPWILPVPRPGRAVRAVRPVVQGIAGAVPPVREAGVIGSGALADRRQAADALARQLPRAELVLAAWATLRAGDEPFARMLLREPPTEPWARYAWRTVAVALGEPSDPAVRPEGCPPALWPGPM